jgi:hypothetical protein
MTPRGAARRLRGLVERTLLAALMSAAVTVLERRLRKSFDSQRPTDADRAAGSPSAR